MAGSVNKVILVGNVGKDPEIRRTQDGRAIASFSIATSETWRDKSTGEKKDRTEWHRISVFNENFVKVIEQYVKKGSKLYVEGQLQTRKWTDQSGVEKFTTEVVLQNFRGELTMLDSRNGGAPGGMAESGQSDYDSGGSGGGGSGGGGYAGRSSGGASGSGSGGGSGYGNANKSGGAKTGGGGKPFDKQIDDEIPF